MWILVIDEYAKDGGPEGSDLHVVFIMILCVPTLVFGKIWSSYLARYGAHIHRLSSNSFSETVYLISRQYDLKWQTY